jgi:cyclo(L-tyrosyl-L-tyrosyl) synthase
MHFFVPDIPAIYTLEAQGYTREKAEWKARRQSQYLKNKIRKALVSADFTNADASEMILDWERLSATPKYISLHEKANHLFETDPGFQDACLQASRWVMTQKVSENEVLSDQALRLAVKYFLAEIPLFADTASVVNQASSVFCYHQRVGFLERFYDRQLALLPSGQQGFLILQPIAEQVFSNFGFDSSAENRVAVEA